MINQLLLLTIFLPLIGAVLLALFGRASRESARLLALCVALLTLWCASQLIFNFPPTGELTAGFAVTDIPWLSAVAQTGLDIRFSVGLDGLGLWMFGLTALLFVTAVLISWEAIQERAPLFYAMLLLLEFGCLGVFTARDIILFYIFFELTLIPLFFLIGIWGSEERRYAAIKFFLFTLSGSLLTFLGLLAVVIWDYQHSGTGLLRFSIAGLTESLQQHPLPVNLQLLLFAALFAGFAIKVPLFPLHTWLPLAHVQAPAAGSVILAGVLLKIGVYGFLRFSLPMLPQATAICMPWMLWLAVAGIVYGALVALAQSDLKKLIAYSSVSHLGFCMLGLFALNPTGVQGSVLQMVNHGISTGGLFAIVGMIYDRYHTRQIADLGGLARRAPWLAFFMVLFTFSSIGVPGLNGFAGEFLILLGMFQRAWAEAPAALATQYVVIAVLATSGVVLGAWYMLWLVQRVFFGPLKEPHTTGHNDHVSDLSLREILALAPLAVFIVWIGLRPNDFLSRMGPSLEAARRPAAQIVDQARSAPALAREPINSLENVARAR
ncbi:MAG: NADH-quinone oxidoreductase subunit M [Planctomycetaceae bacterium]|nr:NADH-quinone oxidoreductase subunit M [Planctomycetaceae bacterium]